MYPFGYGVKQDAMGR